jgi:2-phospho-L-lactate guanylyltransferase
MSKLVALVPLRLAVSAKSRLGAVLAPAERAALASAMARDVLAALAGTPGLARLIVVAPDPAAGALAEEFGAGLQLDPPGCDLAQSLQHACAAAAAAGADGALVIPADLPALTAADVGQLLAAHTGGVTVVPAGNDGGTNALLLTPADTIPCLHGPDSARRHLAAAAAAGVHAVRLPLPGFARDLDTVDDVRWLCNQPAGGHAWRYLRSSGVAGRLMSG